jgi:hypothetical protein
VKETETLINLRENRYSILLEDSNKYRKDRNIIYITQINVLDEIHKFGRKADLTSHKRAA